MYAAIIIPTLNAAATWPQFLDALLPCIQPEQVLVIDSNSTDGTLELASAAGFRVHPIPRSDFNHGRTRQLALSLLPGVEILVYLTQDAFLASPKSVQILIDAFKDAAVGAAYGRQLPRANATPIEAHARSFNYPAISQLRTLASRREFGLKTVFISNSFAAYRRSALLEVGGFPENVIFGEDTQLAGRMLLAGKSIAYVAEAAIYHSHDYSAAQIFRRYFDIGVLHTRDRWLLTEFGQAGGEGRRFFLHEIQSLWPRHAQYVPSALLQTAAKLVGYRLGMNESLIPPSWKPNLSMHPAFWSSPKVASLGGNASGLSKA